MGTQNTDQNRPPVKSWPNLAAYLEDHPEAAEFYRPLLMGHMIRSGHSWDAEIHLDPNGTVYFTRTCC